MKSLKKHFRKLIVVTVLALTVAGTPLVSSASTLSFRALSDNGSFSLLSCGSSAGNYVAVYYAPTRTWTYFDAEPGDCP